MHRRVLGSRLVSANGRTPGVLPGRTPLPSGVGRILLLERYGSRNYTSLDPVSPGGSTSYRTSGSSRFVRNEAAGSNFEAGGESGWVPGGRQPYHRRLGGGGSSSGGGAWAGGSRGGGSGAPRASVGGSGGEGARPGGRKQFEGTGRHVGIRNHAEVPPPPVTPLSAKRFFRSRFFCFVNWFSVQLLGALTARFGERRVLNVVLEEIPFADQVPFKNVLVARHRA